MNAAASHHHTRVQCYSERATGLRSVSKGTQSTYLRLCGGLQALPVTPSQYNLVAQRFFVAFDRV